MRTRKDPAFAVLAATLPPGAADFMDFTMEKLYPVAYRAAAKMGLTRGEAEEAAVRVVQAANGQLASAMKRALMRERAAAGKLIAPS
jgi:hypothetical protein